MATTTQTPVSVTSHPGAKLGYPEGSLRFDWAMVALSALFLAGLWVDGWAHFHGEVDGSFFTPWHFLFYGSFGTVALFLGGNHLRNSGRGYAFAQALPKGYWLSLIGVGVFALGGVGDMIWHTLFGIEAGTEALMSPTHIMLAIGMALVFTGPIRATWLRTREAGAELRGWRTLGPLIIGMTLFMTLIMFFGSYANPMITPYIFMGSDLGGEVVQTNQVYVMNADGTQQTRLAGSGDSSASWAAWSPDGSKIAFTLGDSEPIDADDANENPQSDIYTMNLDASELTRITFMDGAETNAAWSPDSSKLVFTGMVDGNQEIFLLDLTGGEPQRITTTPDVLETGAAWSPDGSQLAYTAMQDEASDIWIMNADGSNPHALTTNGSSGSPAWSPDGTRIVFNTFIDESTGIYTMNADGTDVQRVINSGDLEAYPVYSADGESILFSSWASGAAEIYRIPITGGETLEAAELITDNPALTSMFAAESQDGSQILFVARGQSAENGGEDGAGLAQDFGVTSILFTAALYAGAVALLTWHWHVPFGTFTLLFTGSTAMFTLLNDFFVLIIPALVAGLVVDLLVSRIQPSPERIGRFVTLAFAAPAIYFAFYFLAIGLIMPLPWSIHVWSGAIFMSGVVGTLIALLVSSSSRNGQRLAEI
ncbi:MAG: PD40 domain-containing protein [Anaerolineae bacterium]|nr:PD40 domain-containing protein [Anaerolineae bacterium]